MNTILWITGFVLGVEIIEVIVLEESGKDSLVTFKTGVTLISLGALLSALILKFME